MTVFKKPARADATLKEYQITIVGEHEEPRRFPSFLEAVQAAKNMAEFHSPAEIVVEEVWTEWRKVASYRVQR